MSLSQHSSIDRRKVAAEKVAALKAEGLNGIQIAERLDISRSYAYELLTDPDGRKVAARRASYAGTCERCGSPTSGNDGPGSAASICARCMGPEISARQEAVFRERRDKLAELYRSGVPLKEIAERMGYDTKWPTQAVVVMVTRLRDYGYDLPLRRPRRAA